MSKVANYGLIILIKLAPKLIKLGFHAYLSNGYVNPLSKLNSEKVNKSASFQPWFDKP